MNNGLMMRIYQVCEWVMKLSILNLLWILFSVLGLGVFGLAPASIAACSIIQFWLNGKTEIRIFKTFKGLYFQKFVQANKLAWPLFLLGAILYVDFHIASALDGWGAFILFILLIQVAICYCFVCFYVFPVYLQYDLKSWTCYKIAFLIAMVNPLNTMFMFINLIAIPIVMIVIPGLIPFFSFSVLAYVMMWLAQRSVAQFEQKRKTNVSPEPLVADY